MATGDAKYRRKNVTVIWEDGHQATWVGVLVLATEKRQYHIDLADGSIVLVPMHAVRHVYIEYEAQ